MAASSIRLSFIVNRPKHEPGFRVMRQNGKGRNQHYASQGYATERPEGERYA